VLYGVFSAKRPHYGDMQKKFCLTIVRRHAVLGSRLGLRIEEDI
jgi:hypothetical protein